MLKDALTCADGYYLFYCLVDCEHARVDNVTIFDIHLKFPMVTRHVTMVTSAELINKFFESFTRSNFFFILESSLCSYINIGVKNAC